MNKPNPVKYLGNCPLVSLSFLITPDAISVSASANMIVSPGGGGVGGPTPVFTLPLQNLTVQVGRNATFTCYVRHIQRYQVSL